MGMISSLSAGQIALNIFLASITQVLLWVGGTILVGFLIAIGNKVFYKCTGTASMPVCLATGALGVPLHELGHALFCVVFFHKILEIKLFMPSAPNGVLGYVQHSYNNKNFYQRLGNFFIGVGPIILISGVILLLELLLVPAMFNWTSAINAAISENAGNGNVLWGLILYLKLFFSAESLMNWRWWIYVVLSSVICLHMNLSGADIKGSQSGLLFTVLVFFLLPIIVALFDIKNLSVMTTVNNAMITGGVYYLGVLTMAVIFVYMLVIVAFVLSLLVKLFKLIFLRRK